MRGPFIDLASRDQEKPSVVLHDWFQHPVAGRFRDRNSQVHRTRLRVLKLHLGYRVSLLGITRIPDHFACRYPVTTSLELWHRNQIGRKCRALSIVGCPPRYPEKRLHCFPTILTNHHVLPRVDELKLERFDKGSDEKCELLFSHDATSAATTTD